MTKLKALLEDLYYIRSPQWQRFEYHRHSQCTETQKRWYLQNEIIIIKNEIDTAAEIFISCSKLIIDISVQHVPVT